MDFASETECVNRLIDIWKAILKVDHVSADSTLTGLGGTSLEVVRMRSHIRVHLERDVALEDILNFDTPARLAPVVLAACPWDRET